MSGAQAVCTPFGLGASLYPDLKIDTRGERSLLIAVLGQAMRDVEWLEAIEARPRSEWKKHDHVKYRRLTRGVVEARTFLAEQRQLRAS